MNIYQNSKSKRIAALLITAMAGLSAATTPTSASVYNSYVSKVRTGFESIRLQHHSNNAIQAGLGGCSTNLPRQNAKIDIEARQDISYRPDRSIGSKNFKGCLSNPVRLSFGNHSAGKYFMKVHSWDFQYTSARNFNIYYRYQ